MSRAVVRRDPATPMVIGCRGRVRLVWLTPSLDGIFTGAAGDRRRFLDRLVLTLDPAHARRVVEFERLARSRNRLLEESGDPQWLDAVEAELAESALALANARAEAVERLTRRITAQARDADATPSASLALVGAFEAERARLSSDEAGAAYRVALRTSRGRDRAAGRTLHGPHRSDLAIAVAGNDMPAALSSTGEQKALLLGLILAHAELVGAATGTAPVLLLDEVVAHLDPVRRAALFDRLARLGCQTLMTGTDAHLFSALAGSAERFEVEGGAVRQLD